MKKVLIITYYWPPSGGAGVQRWLKFIKYFPGFDVLPVIITVDENYASYPVLDHSLEKEIPEKIKIVRTKTKEPFGIYRKIAGKKQIPSGGFANEYSSSFIDVLMRFFRGNFFIPDARKGWNKFGYNAACEVIRNKKPDVIITSSPPHSTQIIGLKLKKQFGLPWIADMRDPWTDIYYYKKMLHTPLAKWIDRKYERDVLENADKIVTVSAAIKNLFLQKSKRVNPENIIVIPNGFDETDFENKQPLAVENKFIITYTGTIAESYAPYSFFHAIEICIKNNQDKKILFRFIGTMPERIYYILKKKFSPEQFEYIPYSSHDKVIEWMLSSSVLYLPIPINKKNKGILTGKLFEYLAAQKPIIATGPADGDAAAIISSCNAGKMFEPDDQNGMVTYLQSLLNEWKKNNKLSAGTEIFRKYSRKVLAQQFSDLLSKITR